MRFTTALCAGLLIAGSVAGSGFVGPALAGPADLKVIGQQCSGQLHQTPAVCDCMVQKASTQLNSNQQAFMAAQVTGNTAEVARIQSMMTAQEAAATAQFMGSVIGQCGG
jgi:hypothetical protein